MSGTLALAASIAAMERDQVRALLARRVAAAGSGTESNRALATLRSLHNPLDLAIELLRPESIASALRRLDRASIAVLLGRSGRFRGPGIAETEETLRLQGLIGLDSADGASVELPEVAEALGRLRAPDALASTEALRDDPGGSASADASVGAASPGTSAWFSPALTSTVRAAALLRALGQRPVRLSRKGAVTSVMLRELTLVTHDDVAATERLARVLQFADLAVPFTPYGGQALLVPSASGEEWLALPQPERWSVLAESVVGRASEQLRRAIELSGDDLTAAVERTLRFEFPLLAEPMLNEASDWSLLAEHLGLAVEGRLAPPALALLEGRAGAALAAAEQEFPAPAAGVYLQPDLSVVVPGPLAPDDERALAALAETEQLGVASTMRLSPASLARALRGDFTVGSIRAVLERLSLTGIPQPLDFLLGDLERSSAVARPEAPRAAAWLARNSRGLDLRQDDPMSEDLDREAVLGAAAERIYSAGHDASGSSELAHRIELAIRDRSPVRVTVAGPEERTFVLVPLSLASGRLRATDQAAGVERTLPVSAITEIEAA